MYEQRYVQCVFSKLERPLFSRSTAQKPHFGTKMGKMGLFRSTRRKIFFPRFAHTLIELICEIKMTVYDTFSTVYGPKTSFWDQNGQNGPISVNPTKNFFSQICAYTYRVDLWNKNDGLRYFFHGLRPKNLILGPKWAKWAYFGQPDEKFFFPDLRIHL